MTNSLSRIETYSKKKKFNKRLSSFTAVLYFIAVLVLDYYSYKVSVVAPIIFTAMASPLFGWYFCKKNFFTIFLFVFLLYPMGLGCYYMLIVGYLSSVYNFSLNTIPMYSSVLFLPSIVSVTFLYLNRKQKNFLVDSKLALEFLNAFIIIITGFATLFAYMSSNFSFIYPVFDMNKILNQGFQPRDAFNYLFLYISLPFLISCSSCKFLVEIFLEKNKS